jgi:predicted DNA-binding transcriptional regulator YafY
MSEVIRLYRYQALLSSRRALSRAEFITLLEVSPATFKRDLAKLRDQLGIPIEYDRDAGGYVLKKTGEAHELPGIWLNKNELLALATIQKMLKQLAPSLLGPHLCPLERKLSELLEKQGLNTPELSRRVKLLDAGKRSVSSGIFEIVAQATFNRKRLRLDHFNRTTGGHSSRDVSPQDLSFYRGNWYLNAWCHLRSEPRKFSIDAIELVTQIEEEALEMSDEDMLSAFGLGYGIYTGQPLQHALLVFSPERARWVQEEQWHKDQVGKMLPDGHYQLEVPYTDERELVADLLGYGSSVTALKPASLVKSIKDALITAASNYS